MVFDLLLGFIIPNVDNFAHIGGRSTGAGDGFLFAPTRVPTLAGCGAAGTDSGTSVPAFGNLGTLAVRGARLAALGVAMLVLWVIGEGVSGWRVSMLNGRWPRVTADGRHPDGLEAEVTTGTLPVDDLGASMTTSSHAWSACRRMPGSTSSPMAAPALRTRGGPPACVGRGRPRAGWLLVRTWQATASLTDRVVAQAIQGPYTLARRVHRDRSATQRTDFALEMAAHLGAEPRALAAAGCPMALIEEPDAVLIGGYPSALTNEVEAELFGATQERLLTEPSGLHAMLVVTGGSAWAAGPEAILGAPYQSYLFDLIGGPDNWNLIREVPGDRGVVCGALRADSAADQLPELVWAARYAASSNGRGLERVGLTNATPLEDLDSVAIGRAAAALAKASRLAQLSPDQAVAEGLDPRAIRQPDTRPPRVRRSKPATGGSQRTGPGRGAYRRACSLVAASA